MVGPLKYILLTMFFSKLLVELLGEDILESPPELDRAHRTLAVRGTKKRFSSPEEAAAFASSYKQSPRPS